MPAGRPPLPGLARTLGLAAGLLFLSALPARATEDGADRAFHTVVTAWKTRCAGDVAQAMEDEGSLRIGLLSPRVTGTYRSAQAKRTLGDYFDRVSAVTLKDVTPRGQKDARGYRVRTFEYRYQPQGQDPQTALLAITLKADRGQRWHLVAVEERPARRDVG